MVGFIKAVLICISVSITAPGMTGKGNERTRCLPMETPTLASVMREVLSETLSDISDTFFIPAEAEEESKITHGVLILDASIVSSEK